MSHLKLLGFSAAAPFQVASFGADCVIRRRPLSLVETHYWGSRVTATDRSPVFSNIRKPSAFRRINLKVTVNAMISGAHVVVYSKDADADREFLRNVLGFRSVDAGHGWLIFALPSAEAAVHPAQENNRHELYLMCSDLSGEITNLRARGVECEGITEASWGSITKIRLPGGGKIGLYEPKHPRP